MKKIDIHLILTSTNGFFTEKQVPALYVQIQRHRGYLERKIKKQISFTEAVYSWMENYYQPIMKIADSRGMALAFPEKTTAQIYFMICNRLDTMKSSDVKEAALSLIDETSKRARRIVERTIA